MTNEQITGLRAKWDAEDRAKQEREAAFTLRCQQLELEPRYPHDCDRCHYFGQWYEYDLYMCLSPKYGPNYIARFGADGDYISVTPRECVSCEVDAPIWECIQRVQALFPGFKERAEQW